MRIYIVSLAVLFGAQFGVASEFIMDDQLEIQFEDEFEVQDEFEDYMGSVNFGRVPVRRARDRVIRVRNVGQTTFEGLRVRSTHPDFRVFSRCYRRIEPGDSCRVRVTFRPFRRGSYSARLTFRERGFSDYMNMYGTAERRRVRPRPPRRRPR